MAVFGDRAFKGELKSNEVMWLGPNPIGLCLFFLSFFFFFFCIFRAIPRANGGFQARG